MGQASMKSNETMAENVPCGVRTAPILTVVTLEVIVSDYPALRKLWGCPGRC